MKQLLLLACLLALLSCQQDQPTDQLTDGPTPLPTTDTLTYELFSFSDTATLVRDFPGSPTANYHVNTLVVAAENEELNTLINTALAKDIAGDNAPIKVTNLPQTLRIAAREILSSYRKQDVDTSNLVNDYNDYMLELSYDTQLLLNTKGLLTLATAHYAYTGGVHGNHYTTLHSFATDSLQLLAFKDIFLPASDTTLSELLTKKADHLKIGYEPEQIPITQNVAFTEEGLLFNYPPYEIASFAEGEIEILLPYGEVSHLLTGLAESLVLTMRQGNS